MLTTLIAIYLWIAGLALLVLMVRQDVLRTHDLMSLRNIYLLGFIVVQLSSGAAGLLFKEHGHFYIAASGRTGLLFAVWCTIFLALYLWSYHKGWLVTRLARKVPTTTAVPGSINLLLTAVVLTLLAIPLRFSIPIQGLGVLASFASVGFASIACGLVGWVWGRQLLNPALAAYGLILLVVNLVNVTTGEFGRRSLVAVLAGLIWGMYYSAWRYLNASALWKRLTVVSIGPLILVALYTSVRSSAEHDRSAAQHFQEISSGGNIEEGLLLLLGGQNTGSGSMWVMENYPDNYEYRHLLTLWYFVAIDIPRAIWEGKPEPLSVIIADQARAQGVNREKIKLPCGILGNAAAEGGWYALLIYAIVTGLFIRFFDEIIQINPTSPYVVLPIGSSLGQILGLARGETSVFANTFVLTTIMTWVCMIAVGKMLERAGVGRGSVLAADEQVDPQV